MPSSDACESVNRLIEDIDDGVARSAVHIAINSAFVEDSHVVEAHPKVILNAGIIHPDPMIGVSFVVLMAGPVSHRCKYLKLVVDTSERWLTHAIMLL